MSNGKWRNLTLVRCVECCLSFLSHGSWNWLDIRFTFFFFFCLFRAAPMAYGSSQARGWIGAVAASLHQSSWQHPVLNPTSKAKDWTWALMDASKICFCWATMGTPSLFFYFFIFYFFNLFFVLFFCHFLGCSRSIWRFPGYGSNQSCSHQPMPEPQQLGIQVTSATYTSAHSNTRSLTHWARPGNKPTTS